MWPTILERLLKLCDVDSSFSKYKTLFNEYLLKNELNENDEKEIIGRLSRLLMDPDCAAQIAKLFPQLVIPILTLALQNKGLSNMKNTETEVHRLNCVIFSKLLPINPDVLGIVLKYFESHPSPFEPIEVSPSSEKKLKKVAFRVKEVSDYDIVSATHTILSAATNHFKYTWNWSVFYKFLENDDPKLRWVVLKSLGLVLNMSEKVLKACAAVIVPTYEKFLLEEASETNETDFSSLTVEYNQAPTVLNNSKDIISVAGVLLPVFDKEKRLERRVNLISVPSMESNLKSLALAVAARRCVCLQGPVGCGKTTIVEYLADITGRGSSNFIKVQLGDQTDSKMLLGTYRCTDIPGEFVWQPGVLTQAVVSGKWLLLEDIDSAAMDVASVVSNLMETGTLSVPGYRDTIYANSGFQLFLTQRLIQSSSGLCKQFTNSSNLLEKHWHCINMNPLSKEELITIVEKLFPQLTTIATRIVDVFLLFSMGNHELENDEQVDEVLTVSSGRLISTRDLIKWCTRIIVDFDVASPESALKALQDAIDLFCCSVSDKKQRLNLAISIGATLGIIKTKAEYFINTHKPSVSVNSSSFTVGRVRIPMKKDRSVQFDPTKCNFSFTRPSAVLLERITTCVAQKEPVLLVGETGTGKTSSIQYLAKSTGQKLIVINMNQQSESADLLGGYKPVDIKILITPIREEFEILFRSYFDVDSNKQFLEHIAKCYKQGNWKALVTLMSHSTNAALKRLEGKTETPKSGEKRKSQSKETEKAKNCQGKLMKWMELNKKLEKLKTQVKNKFSLTFAFIEGSLIKALEQGHWILLDEINLASSETLECLSGLLEGSSGSLSLFERGDNECIKRHNDFTIFACMNPATDVGKKELPIGLRNRFTEFYVDELTESIDLNLLVDSYLSGLNLPSIHKESIVKFYLKVREESVKILNDGTGHKPHFSLRTLCRALTVAASNPCGNIYRSLYEAFSLSFLTQLDAKSYSIVQKLIIKMVLDNKTMKINSLLGNNIPKPISTVDNDYINFEGYWVCKGLLEPEIPTNYILTDSVKRNLKDLVRVVSIGKMPILLQGDTSVGKTSLITYLAKASGHICVRINNHEHTDVQEYVGNYVADDTGKLIFKEGILVEAMRKGYWIILDELNLAPSDVLEALNRVLDDNRELFIPETQQVVKAHMNFMLFATQNPPGMYGGRKVLSRAFRNRFVELHFNEIPSNELEVILHQRCNMPKSYCKQIIHVMNDLQMRRKSTAAFMGKQGFITLRDLFRWGERYRLAPEKQDFYDWSQHLADEGYLVLAAKVRKPEEAEEIQHVINKYLKRNVDPVNLFSLNANTSPVTKPILQYILDNSLDGFEHIVWTYQMRRMAVLVIKSYQFKEPILLVGETGGGKTTVCQLIAAMKQKKLFSVNCHMHTESSDFLGNLRPIRNYTDENKKLFEWVNGPLITAMQSGDLFLADEISLADDSVLERLNSLLEPERSLLLPEKSSDTDLDSVITAHQDFCFIGTMNPGGDFGKKELSPALRNRFTEIWCQATVSNEDYKLIIMHNLKNDIGKEEISSAIIHFLDCLKLSEIGKKFVVSIRDILTWINFINICRNVESNIKLSLDKIFVEGAYLTYLDSLGCGVTGNESLDKLKSFKNSLFNLLQVDVKKLKKLDEIQVKDDFNLQIETDGNLNSNKFGIEPFYIDVGAQKNGEEVNFTFDAPTTKSNTLKILRALQLKKPLLLEGSPGVGKTSLVSAIAKAAGFNLLRINLSDQTDISDLFGTDLPVEGGIGGQFAWKDGPFLRALKTGDWILLDELNLASQSVLEGLNACLDHRGEVYIPELGRTFTIKCNTKLFACQNPVSQGGARRGLPKSFLNRFTQVFINTLSDDDLKIITQSQFPHLTQSTVDKIIQFNSIVSSEAGKSWGYAGSPWEMNLRDITRWCQLIHRSPDCKKTQADAVQLIYTSRMRTSADRQKVREVFERIFEFDEYKERQPYFHIDDNNLYLDDIHLNRMENSFSTDHNLLILRDQVPVLKSLAQCVQMNWMPILVGGSGTGKSSVVRLLAQLVGQKLRSIAVNSAMDTTEILGGFEQTDYNRHLEELIQDINDILTQILKSELKEKNLKRICELQSQLEKIQHLSYNEPSTMTTTTMAIETEIFLKRTMELSQLISTMKTFDNLKNSKLMMIEDKIKNLSKLVEQEKCLNAGGKFEWVDSVLVKCLQDGSWLLIDQVNLCSPAVLDRLNRLLEPGGVLTIGERGVDNDGNIRTIIPHKNFRLFLTMNPQFGEISRAMRNRGVEIFVLGHKENKNVNEMDLKSMLFNVGLTGSNYQMTLLNIHKEILNQEISTDKFNIIQLQHTAFLITQQILRGFPAEETFISACSDVYIKSNYIQSSTRKYELTSIIKQIIEQSDITKSIKPILNVNDLTLSSKSLQSNVQLSLIKQQGGLIVALINQYLESIKSDKGEKDSLKNYVDSKLWDTSENLMDILPYLLVIFYEKASISDITLRSNWLKKLIINMKTKGFNDRLFIKHLIEKINKVTQEVLSTLSDLGMSSTFPWYQTVSISGEKVLDYNTVQNLSLRLHMIITNINYPNKLLTNKDGNKKIVRVEEYSTSVYKNPELENEDSDNSPLLIYFTPFVMKITRWLFIYFKHYCQCLDSNKFIDLREKLQWFTRFYEQGDLIYSNANIKSQKKQKNLQNQTKMMLIVHFRWLIKFLNKTFDESVVSNDEHLKVKESLFKFLDDVNKFISYQKSLKKLGKKLKHHFPYPKAFQSITVIKSYEFLSNLTNNFSFYNQDNIKLKLILILYQFEDGLNLRMEEIETWGNIFNNKFNEIQGENVIKSREEFIKRYELTSKSSVDIINETLKIHTKNELIERINNMKIWPIYEYLFVTIVYKILQQINSGEKLLTDEVIIVKLFLSKMQKISSIPTHLIGLLNIIMISDLNEVQHLLYDVFKYLVEFCGRSNTFNNSHFINYLHELIDNKSTDTEESYKQCDMINDIDYKKNSTTLLTILSGLLIPNYCKNTVQIGLSTAPLEFYTVQLKQLKIVNQILWINSSNLNSPMYQYKINDYKYLCDYTSNYLSQLERLYREMVGDDELELKEQLNDESNYNVVMNNFNLNNNNKNDERKIKNCFLNPLKKLFEIYDKNDKENIDEKCIINRGLLWILIGFHQTFIYSHLGFIDPINKTKLKLKYIKNDINDINQLINVNDMDGYILNDDGWMSREGNFSRVTAAKIYLEKLIKDEKILNESIGYRPDNEYNTFIDIVTELSNFNENSSKPESILQTAINIHHQLINLTQLNNDKTIDSDKSEILNGLKLQINILKNNQSNWKVIYENLKSKYFSNYRDVLMPILNGLIQMIHGVNVLINEVERQMSNYKFTCSGNKLSGTEFLYNLIRFPTIGCDQNLLNLIDLCTSINSKEFIKINLNQMHHCKSNNEIFKMMKNGLLELYNYISVDKQFDKNLWNLLNSLLSEITLIWQLQLKEKEKKAAESESLYIKKGQVLSEDEEINQQLNNIFPLHCEKDFDDIDNEPTLEQQQQSRIIEEDETSEVNESVTDLISDEDIVDICKIHSKIIKCFIPPLWLKSSDSKLSQRNYIDPLIQRYNLFGLLYPQLESSLDESLSSKLCPSFNVLTWHTINRNKGEVNDDDDEEDKFYDFYNSSNIKQVNQCSSILNNLIGKVESLLMQWPEHPTLISIIAITSRINQFSITSPLSRFLTGLELLLTKVREWEENAHSGVSLLEHSGDITRQVISWRKLELNCWKNCLNVAFERLKNKASKWWFYLYSLVESYVNKSSFNCDVDPTTAAASSTEPITKKKLIELLEIFMNQSSLVEFQARLDLLLTFHVHSVYFEESETRDELVAIFWNVYHYYNKFSNDVNRKINSLRAPIEKKLKDFVKIARWNDINYWSVKQTVEKTHRTLVKFIREFESILKQNTGSILIVKPSSYISECDQGEWDKSKHRDYQVNPKDFIIISDGLECTNVQSQNDIIIKIGLYTKKSKKFCKNTISNSDYPKLRQQLESSIEDFMSHASKLKDMDIDRSLPKGKQKTHAKSILQQKRMALTNYFKFLTNVGLSYRKGIFINKNNKEVPDMTVPPLDLAAAFKDKSVENLDELLMTQWNGCESYYYNSCIKLNALQSALTKIQTDLGPQNMERCQGFSIHLMSLAQKQKKLLFKYFNHFSTLKDYVHHLSNLNHEDTTLPGHKDLKNISENLRSLLSNLLIALEQINVYLNTCPDDDDPEVIDGVVVLGKNSSELDNSTKTHEFWKSMSLLIKSNIKSVDNLIVNYDKLFLNTPVGLMRTSVHYNALFKMCKELEKIKIVLEKFTSSNESHQLSETVSIFVASISEWIRDFKTVDKFNDMSRKRLSDGSERNENLKDFESCAGDLVRDVLLVIQNKYKGNEDHDGGDGKELMELEDNGLHQKLIESLRIDIESLKLDEINSKLETFVNRIVQLDQLNLFYSNKILLKCLPILKQYLFLSQFYIIEQVATFRTTCKLLYLQLNVFLDLAFNGFCVPKDLDLEDGETDENGTEQNKNQSGIGLGDGEGKKDVSDRIESEDQLEDARPADEEPKKDEDKDCKEEEGGIEMSENFDGKLQDLDKADDDENDQEKEEEDDNDDLDKEMGDTDKGADQLDQEIWGDEDESDEDEEGKENGDEEGHGEQTGEKEMSARDESDSKDENKTDNADSKEGEREEKEINELNEPEVNDDQVDPYHGKQNPLPEPEPMDLPEDLNLDDGEAKEDQPGDEENPFDIDGMKECMPPPEESKEEEKSEEKTDDVDEEKMDEDSSDDEQEGPSKMDTDVDVKDLDQPEDAEESNAAGQEQEKEGEKHPEEEKDVEGEEQALPSLDDSTQQVDAANQPDAKADGSRDKVAKKPEEDEHKKESVGEENNEDDGNDKGTGQAQSEEQSEGHVGSAMHKNTPIDQNKNEQEQKNEKRRNPGESDENRALVEHVEPVKKKQRMINAREELRNENEEKEVTETPEKDENNQVDMCQHVKEGEKFDDQAMDAATEDQIKKQQVADPDEKETPENQDEVTDVDMLEDEKDEEVIDDANEIDSESVPSKKDQENKKKMSSKNNFEENLNVEQKVDVEGDIVDTTAVRRPDESAFFTNLSEEFSGRLTFVEQKRQEVEEMLSHWSSMPSTEEALAAWNCLSAVTELSARDLSEKLRLVLEPTQATRLKGDYRTGKRINMRKIIPYIASQFRKDKIWLRRTKPSKRDYQIVLALDDSSSMADNHSKELAFESLCLISKAMGYLEVGQLGVVSFGESSKILHRLGDPFTEQSGSKLIQEMSFNQTKTMIGQLVNFTVDMLDIQKGSNDNAKLMVVLSDGRGIFSEGIEMVNQAVRRAKLANIFLVFIIVENPKNKDSILDIRMPKFENGKLMGIYSYMDSFPFPFYMILKDINALPGVLSDALRQWFEIVGKIDT